MEFLKTATVRITPEILSLIAEIDEFKGAWRAIGRIAPERLSSLRRVPRSKASVPPHVSKGTAHRPGGGKAAVKHSPGSFTTPDEQEVASYAEVMETGFSAYEAISFWGGFSLLSKARCNPVLA